MALWQWVILAVPRGPLEEQYGSGLVRLDDLAEDAFWSGKGQVEQLRASLDDLFPRADSWGEGVELWGEEVSHDAQLITSDGSVVSLRLRLDARQNCALMLKRIAARGERQDLLFWELETGAVLSPKASELEEAFKASGAVRFVEDPRGVLHERSMDAERWEG